MTSAIHILALHAHPDDVEFQCAGALALVRERGARVTIATMTPGDCGGSGIAPEEIAAIRRGEAERSAARIGAAYHCLEFRDLAIFDDDSSRRRVVEFLRRVRPDVVLTAPPVDYLIDHETTSRLVRDACFAAPAPNYATRIWEPAPPLEKIPELVFVDPLGGVDRDQNPVQPHYYIDITSVYEIKCAMLSEHASQREWLRKHHGVDEYLDGLDRWSGERGREIGVARAEGYRRYLGHPYPSGDLLLRTIGQDGRGGRIEDSSH